MPGVQVHTDDGALAKARGETRLVTLVVQQPWGQQGGVSLGGALCPLQPTLTQATRTSVGEAPAVLISAKQAAECVVVLVQVHI